MHEITPIVVLGQVIALVVDVLKNHVSTTTIIGVSRNAVQVARAMAVTMALIQMMVTKVMGVQAMRAKWAVL